MHIFHINDCQDENARIRLAARSYALLEWASSFAGIHSEQEAGGCLIDVLDTLRGSETASVVLVNIAPRNGEAKKHENGAPFCYFWHERTLVVSTASWKILSLVNKFCGLETVHTVETLEALSALQLSGNISEGEAQAIGTTQFRSLNFSPLLAAAVLKNISIPTEIVGIPKLLREESIWFTDNFGNLKTTYTREDVIKDESWNVRLLGHSMPYYDRLRDVPDGVLACVSGSSGYWARRCLEIVVQGGSAEVQLSKNNQL